MTGSGTRSRVRVEEGVLPASSAQTGEQVDAPLRGILIWFGAGLAHVEGLLLGIAGRARLSCPRTRFASARLGHAP
jgi:hypothetical protein